VRKTERMDSLLAGRYRLRQRIGSGGMASVWLARDEVLVRPVAVKLIDPDLVREPAFRERFREEARAAAALSHPHIVTVHDYGESDGTPYIVMELLTGTTLVERFPVPDVERVIGEIASALAAAHAARIVHRDIKPTNVFLTSSGVKVLDFGIADDAGMGTPAYLPPENDLSPSADVYALGIVWFEAVKGRRPEPGESLGGLQERCVADSSSARPSAAEVAAALGMGPEEQPAAGQDSAPPEPVVRPRTRVLTDKTATHRRLVLVGGGAAASAVAALTIVLGGAAFRPVAAPVNSSPPGPPPPTAVSATPMAPITSSDSPSASASATPSTKPYRRRSRTRTTPTAPLRLLGATPPGAIEALTRMRRTVDEGMAVREVRPDVAVDLDNLITGLQGELAAGQRIDLRQRVTELRAKIAVRLREGGLTKARADELSATLSAV
jgi:serine/threonine protein kinase